MKYIITGSVVPAVKCHLKKGEQMYTQSGGMVCMGEHMTYHSKIQGGIANGIGRKFRGESLFLTTYESQRDDAMVVFGSTLPGSVKEIFIRPGQDFICQKTAFLCAQSSVRSKVCFMKRLSTGFLSGTGFILQHLYGTGVVFLEVSGDILSFYLQERESLYVNSGCLVGFDSSVDFAIERVKGIKNMVFGGEGLFFTKLTGPGNVYLQTQNIKEFANRLRGNMSLTHLNGGE